ncbi:hypothetical protein [Streptomyces griseorubiginosus]|uniref:hypothetical protein n=1 Tax=Streptomyces griseorubiginosus TaxID=67304 RepID=UPI0036EF2B20
MTAQADCDPLWTDEEWERLCQRGAEYLHDPTDPRHRDLRGQLTALEIHTMTDVRVVGAWL